MFEMVGRYFLPVNKNKTITVNLYSGFRAGSDGIRERDVRSASSYDRFYQTRSFGWYLQPSFNFLTKNNFFRVSIYYKWNYIRYGSFDSNFTVEEDQYFGFSKIRHQSLTFLDAGTIMQFRLTKRPWLFLELSSSFSTDERNGRLRNTHLYSRTGNVSIGLTADLGKIKPRFSDRNMRIVSNN